MDDYEPTEEEREAVIAEQRALGAFGEAWANKWLATLAVADRRDADVRQTMIDDFVRRLQADFARRWPRG
jgi:hypothetical protein